MFPHTQFTVASLRTTHRSKLQLQTNHQMTPPTLKEAKLLPPVVMECEWEDSWPCLDENVEIWLQGDAPTVQRVFLIRWSKTGERKVAGRVEMYGRDEAGATRMLQTEVFDMWLGHDIIIADDAVHIPQVWRRRAGFAHRARPVVRGRCVPRSKP